MSISQKLCEVRDRDFGGKQFLMAREWVMHQGTLSRWLRADHVPDATWYSFLAKKLGLSIGEIHELCEEQRNGARTHDLNGIGALH